MMRVAILSLMATALLSFSTQAQAPVGVPVAEIAPPPESKVTFNVKASVAIDGTFDKWNATLKFASTDPTTGVLDIKVEADSVNTGSGMKNGKLKGKDFFDVKNGTFTIRGVSKPETLVLTASGEGTGSGTIKGAMAFDRKDYGMNHGIPFIRIADRVEVDVDLQIKRVSGPSLLFKQ